MVCAQHKVGDFYVGEESAAVRQHSALSSNGAVAGKTYIDWRRIAGLDCGEAAKNIFFQSIGIDVVGAGCGDVIDELGEGWITIALLHPQSQKSPGFRIDEPDDHVPVYKHDTVVGLNKGMTQDRKSVSPKSQSVISVSPVHRSEPPAIVARGCCCKSACSLLNLHVKG